MEIRDGLNPLPEIMTEHPAEAELESKSPFNQSFLLQPQNSPTANEKTKPKANSSI